MRTKLKQVQSSDQNLQLIQDAIQVALDQTTSYQVKTTANWVSPPPSTLYDAIDRIAVLLKSIHGGPIP